MEEPVHVPVHNLRPCLHSRPDLICASAMIHIWGGEMAFFSVRFSKPPLLRARYYQLPSQHGSFVATYLRCQSCCDGPRPRSVSGPNGATSLVPTAHLADRDAVPAQVIVPRGVPVVDGGVGLSDGLSIRESAASLGLPGSFPQHRLSLLNHITFLLRGFWSSTHSFLPKLHMLLASTFPTTTLLMISDFWQVQDAASRLCIASFS
ncbi:hypothetical protein BT67DRAFT_34785 [Trichocladium antarcticum]|uniref:Uncharacterized protein n=1 Tax=Trichocladium antarcticum TaxID=1450529 RepID=A0AAN6UJ09_9PEZI|nr:hypothetical protein BT67DRAFT_34785 [Trichocladium antarcticum]